MANGKISAIDGVEFTGRFLMHLLPPRMHHIRRYGWMGRRTNNEKLVHLQGRFGTPEPEREAAGDGEDAAVPKIEDEPSRPCRCCAATMRLTGVTYRPKVSEILDMPLAAIRAARPGAIVTLGARVLADPRLRAKLPSYVRARLKLDEPFTVRPDQRPATTGTSGRPPPDS